MAPLSAKFLFGSALAVSLYHVTLWAMLVEGRGIAWTKLLRHWDGAWYGSIVRFGYAWPNYAFFPLYPVMVRGFAGAIGLSKTPEIAGALLSFLLLMAFTWLVVWLQRLPASGDAALMPRSRMAWLLLLLTPSSYVLQSMHTEALFMFLTAAAFFACARQRWLLAAAIAGLAALTKNQGVLAAFAVGVWAAAAHSGWLGRLRALITSGMVSGSLFALFPLYLWHRFGDPLGFLNAQQHWRPGITLAAYPRTFWFGNAWQEPSPDGLRRHALFAVLVLATVLVWRRNPFVGFYAMLFLALMPASGDFVGIYRYATVLFPLWFVISDRVERLPVAGRWLFMLVVLYVNQRMTRAYGLESYAY